MIVLFEYFLLIIGGLFLFLYGINLISTTLTKITNDKFKKIIVLATSNDYLAILIGIIITCLIHSSSAISVILITFLTAKLIDLRSSMFILIGANIGTTITTFIVSLDITKYYLIFIIIGCYLLLISTKHKNIGTILFGLGCFFMGLNFISNSVNSLINNYPNLFSYFTSENLFLNFIISTLFTSIIQSSTAMIKITQDLFNLNFISLKTALMFVIGANIGTTMTGIIASFKTNKKALFLALFNLGFNLTTALFIIICFNRYYFLIDLFKNYYQLSLNNTITLFHFMFNLTGTIIFCILIPNKTEKID